MKLSPLGIAAVLMLGCLSTRAIEPIKVKLASADEDRRFVAMSTLVPADAPKPSFVVRDLDAGQTLPCQWEPALNNGYRVYWLVPQVAKGQARTLSIEQGQEAAKGGVTIAEKDGYLSISAGSREITRYHFGGAFEKYKKPYFYPLMVGGTNICRGFPMDPQPGETNDHPHHTGVWFAHGEVDNVDYWSKEPIKHAKFVLKESGPVMAHLIAENAWGANVIERQDVRIYDIGEDVLMDWAITLTAVGKPVELGKTKEGGFSVRVATELTSPEPGKNKQPAKDRGDGKMVDALGNQDEPPVREHAANWADNYGVIGGKTVGVAIMNHPQSWRYPTNWHVRNYGLFAANAFFVQGPHTLEPGKPITLRYRLYGHNGDPKQAGVQAVYAGYAATAVAE
ncbi:MAG: PmoA family protein [Tepidisphaerales bacterium]